MDKRKNRNLMILKKKGILDFIKKWKKKHANGENDILIKKYLNLNNSKTSEKKFKNTEKTMINTEKIWIRNCKI